MSDEKFEYQEELSREGRKPMSMFGTRPHNPPAGILPTRLEDQILPRPQHISLTGKMLQLTRGGTSTANLIYNQGASGHEATAIAWLRRELRQLFGWESVSPNSAEVHFVVGVAKPGSIVQKWIEGMRIALPSEKESYALQIGEDRVILVSNDGEGLLRGVTTLVQSLSKDREREICVPCGEIEDWPALPLRLLIGWVRSDRHPREVIDFAFRYKFNRIFYGLWNWTTRERLEEEDRRMVEYARKHGIELMFQLSRLSFPDDFDATNTDHVNRVVTIYDEAVEAGFRSFGIMFDDQTLQSIEAEMNLTMSIHSRLEERLGKDFEFTFVPEVYWVPGELPGWPPQPERAEEFRLKHIEYLQKLGASLPEGVEIYIANNWNDYPEGYAEVQEKEFNRLAQRKPIFFENQLVNDYRRSVILPFPVHNRPPEFATAMKGYGVNLPMPYSAYHPSVITCASLAWNPAGYDPPLAWGAALQQYFGTERTHLVLEGLNQVNQLWIEWNHPYDSITSHYASLRDKLKKGLLSEELVHKWRQQLFSLKTMFTDALAKPGGGTEALQHYIEEMERLELDMGLLEDILETQAKLPHLPTEKREAALNVYRARQEARFHTLLSIQVHRSPSVPGLQMLLPQLDGTSLLSSQKLSQIPGGWWVSYFYSTMKDEIARILQVGEEILAPMVTGFAGAKSE